MEKTHSRCITDINVKDEMIRLLEGNISLRIGECFLNRTQNKITIRKKYTH